MTMRRFLKISASIVFSVFVAMQSFAQKIATLTVNMDNNTAGIAVPVHVNLDAITAVPDSSLSLVEVQGSIRKPVAYQIQNKGQRVLFWLIDGLAAPGKRTYELVKGLPMQMPDHIQLVKDSGYLTISANNKNLLRYNYKTVYPPAGVDTVFKRSGFIHPLWSPGGQRLTRIGAPDHYHHFGLWDPWTHTLFEGDTVDFWNLKEKQGTVRFANFTSITSGPVYGDFQVLQQHIAFKRHGPEKAKEKLALNELQSVRVYQLKANQDYYLADITIQLNCADSPIKLLAYRYGGLGWRATEKWDGKNSEMLTSEGHDRDHTDGSKARWVIVQGAIDNEYAGAVMMSYPTNYNYPEPLRVWNSKTNGRGDVYANFSPTKDKDWPLIPGNDYVLKYRFVVFNGHFDKEKAEAAWHYFAYPPEVTVKLANQ